MTLTVSDSIFNSYDLQSYGLVFRACPPGQRFLSSQGTASHLTTCQSKRQTEVPPNIKHAGRLIRLSYGCNETLHAGSSFGFPFSPGFGSDASPLAAGTRSSVGHKHYTWAEIAAPRGIRRLPHWVCLRDVGALRVKQCARRRQKTLANPWLANS